MCPAPTQTADGAANWSPARGHLPLHCGHICTGSSGAVFRSHNRWACWLAVHEGGQDVEAGAHAVGTNTRHRLSPPACLACRVQHRWEEQPGADGHLSGVPPGGRVPSQVSVHFCVSWPMGRVRWQLSVHTPQPRQPHYRPAAWACICRLQLHSGLHPADCQPPRPPRGGSAGLLVANPIPAVSVAGT